MTLLTSMNYVVLSSTYAALPYPEGSLTRSIHSGINCCMHCNLFVAFCGKLQSHVIGYCIACQRDPKYSCPFVPVNLTSRVPPTFHGNFKPFIRLPHWQLYFRVQVQVEMKWLATHAVIVGINSFINSCYHFNAILCISVKQTLSIVSFIQRRLTTIPNKVSKSKTIFF